MLVSRFFHPEIETWRRTNMASFKCKDIGMNCGFEVKDDNQDELMKIVALHAQNTHNMKEVPAETVEKIKKAIKK
jgi:predicted small metal-binding protein